jgi:hypothetical protein
LQYNPCLAAWNPRYHEYTAADDEKVLLIEQNYSLRDISDIVIIIVVIVAVAVAVAAVVVIIII